MKRFLLIVPFLFCQLLSFAGIEFIGPISCKQAIDSIVGRQSIGPIQVKGYVTGIESYCFLNTQSFWIDDNTGKEHTILCDACQVPYALKWKSSVTITGILVNENGKYIMKNGITSLYPQKLIANGKIVIVRDGKIFNIKGEVL